MRLSTLKELYTTQPHAIEWHRLRHKTLPTELNHFKDYFSNHPSYRFDFFESKKTFAEIESVFTRTVKKKKRPEK
jgi:hypothetical protein